jgi:hypothetical protein
VDYVDKFRNLPTKFHNHGGGFGFHPFKIRKENAHQKVSHDQRAGERDIQGDSKKLKRRGRA